MGEGHRCPILVVDDEANIRDLVAEILETEGYSVLTASNGAEALEVVESLRAADPACPRLLLLDMRMPVLDGWEVARVLKERGLEMPVVVMTAAQNARQWAKEIGADTFLAKPFELDDLIGAVAELAGQPC